LGVSLIYKSDHALFFVVFSLRLVVCISQIGHKSRAFGTFPRSNRKSKKKMSLPPSLYHPPSSYTLVHGRIGRALSGKVRRVAVFLGCEKVISEKKNARG